MDSSSNWSKNVASKLPQWDGEAATLCALDAALHPLAAHAHALAHAHADSSISGDVTPVSITSELEFNSNEATAGSLTDHDLLSAEGEDDEETLSSDACGSPVIMIKNDLSPQPFGDASQPSTSKFSNDFYGLNLQETKENLYKEIPSSSKNYNIETNINLKCMKGDKQYLSNLDSLNLQSKEVSKSKKNETSNNGSRRYSDSSALKPNVKSQGNTLGSRFTTTLVSEDLLKASTSTDSKSNNTPQSSKEAIVPSVTKAKNCNVKAGFKIADP